MRRTPPPRGWSWRWTPPAQPWTERTTCWWSARTRIIRARWYSTPRDARGEQFQLRVEGQEVLTDRLTQSSAASLQQDGSVRPALWHWVEELSVCGPRDRVFTYDPRREIITFGDGLHGAVVMPGPGAVLVTGLVLSRCSGGNIPADSLLAFQEDGTRVEHSAAWGGREAETLAQGRARLLAELNRTRKCLSAEDYERCARQTPGLRLAGARALPGYDPDAPQQRHSAYVSVVVLPAGEGRRPQADRRFLDAVDRQLERCRSICVQARTIAAQYVPFSLTGRLTAAPGTSQEMVRRALEDYFAPCQQRIGAPGCPGELAAALQKAARHLPDRAAGAAGDGPAQLPQCRRRPGDPAGRDPGAGAGGIGTEAAVRMAGRTGVKDIL